MPVDLARSSEARTTFSTGPFVDGVITDSLGDVTLDVVNPSNGQWLGSLPTGCEADTDRAVMSARRAFDDRRWSNAAPSVRKQALFRYADLVAREAPILDALDAEEMGKPLATVAFNAAGASNRVRFYAELLEKITGDVYASDPNSLVLQRRRPRGVVAAISPWNFPTFNAVLKLAPALAAGNCVVLKPSELSSRSAFRLAELAIEAGIPEGVFNVVPGAGEVVGRALGLHEQVDMVTFTGSTSVGKKMLQYAGQSNLKFVMTECGGKSPHVVFADGVDLDAIATSIAGRLIVNQGQVCSVGSRLLVHRSIERELVERIAERLGKVAVGDALDPATTYGPLVSETQLAKVMGYIDLAESDGAELVAGGQRIYQESGGFFVEPTVFRNVDPGAAIAQEEIFGPVLCVTGFDDELEAARLANGTIYGLAAYVWTTSLATGMQMSRHIRSTVLVSAGAPTGEGAPAASSEPFGQSGMGAGSGMQGMESYMHRQLVWFNHP